MLEYIVGGGLAVGVLGAAIWLLMNRVSGIGDTAGTAAEGGDYDMEAP